MYVRGLNCKIRHASTTWKELIRKLLCLPIFRNITEIMKTRETREGFCLFQFVGNKTLRHAVRKRLAKSSKPPCLRKNKRTEYFYIRVFRWKYQKICQRKARVFNRHVSQNGLKRVLSNICIFLKSHIVTA